MSRRGRKPKNCYNISSLKSVKTLDNAEQSIQKDMVLYANSQPQPAIEDDKPQPTFVHMLAYLNRFGVKPPKMINKEAYGYYFEIDEATKIVIINNITDSKFSVQWLNNNNHCETLYSEEDLDTNLAQYLKQLRLPTDTIEHVVSEVANVFYTTNPLEYPTNHTVDDLSNMVTNLATYDNNHSDYRYVTDVVDSEKYDQLVMVAGMDGVTINTVIKNHEIYACAFDSLNNGSDELSKYIDTIPDGILDILYRELLMYDVQQLTQLHTDTTNQGEQPMLNAIENNDAIAEPEVTVTDNLGGDDLVLKDIEDILLAYGVVGEDGDLEYQIKHIPTKIAFAGPKFRNDLYLLIGGFRVQIYDGSSDGASETIALKPLLAQHIKSELNLKGVLYDLQQAKSELNLKGVLYDLQQAKAELITDRHSPERPVLHQQPIIRNMDPVLPLNWGMTVVELFDYCNSLVPAAVTQNRPELFTFTANGKTYGVYMLSYRHQLIIRTNDEPAYVLHNTYRTMPAVDALKDIGVQHSVIVAMLSVFNVYFPVHNQQRRIQHPQHQQPINAPWQQPPVPVQAHVPLSEINAQSNQYNTFDAETMIATKNIFVNMLSSFENAAVMGSEDALSSLFSLDIKTILESCKDIYPEAGFKLDNVYITYDFDKSVGFVYTPSRPIKIDGTVTSQTPFKFATSTDVDRVTKCLLLNAFWLIIVESQNKKSEQKAE